MSADGKGLPASAPPLDPKAWLVAIIDNSDDAILSKTLEGRISSWNVGAERLFGYAADEAIGQHISLIVPENRLFEEERILSKIRQGVRADHILTTRRRQDGGLVDVLLSVSPIKDDDGHILGASTIARDISEIKNAKEQQDLVLREMNHRIKNLFALTTSLVSLSAKNTTNVDDLASEITTRLTALARAHDLTLPDLSAPEIRQPQTTICALLKAVLEPYRTSSGSVDIEGEDAPVGPSALSSIALIIHELATNAAKYGALSNETGTLRISCAAEHDMLNLRWVEVAPDMPSVEPKSEGFGRKLESASVRTLGATIHRTWGDGCLTIELQIPQARLGQ